MSNSTNSFPLNKILEAPFDVPKWLKKLSVPALKAQQQAFNEVKFCATDGCNETQFQWCHVIPASAQLEPFAESGKVCWIPMREHDRWTLRSWWTEDPISKTLVFRGFCNSCDSNLFAKIDRPLVMDSETYLLLAFRSACYFNWRYEVDYRAAELRPGLTRKMVESDPELPRLIDGFEQLEAPEIEKAKFMSDQVKVMTDSLRDAVAAKNFGLLETRVFDFKQDLPIRFSLAASIVNSLKNEHTHVSQIECPQFPGVFLHILDVDGTTKLIFSWLKCIPERFPNVWIEQFKKLSDSGHIADVLLRFMFINNHGLVFKPSFVPTLNHEQSSYLTSSLAGRMYNGVEPEISRVCHPPYFDLGWKLTSVV